MEENNVNTTKVIIKKLFMFNIKEENLYFAMHGNKLLLIHVYHGYLMCEEFFFPSYILVPNLYFFLLSSPLLENLLTDRFIVSDIFVFVLHLPHSLYLSFCISQSSVYERM